jgi:arylsulfatase A-like enzyme/Flp pilus assembly protein TadD
MGPARSTLRGLLAAGLCLALAGASAPGAKPGPLNVLLVSVDTLRADFVGCAGGRAVPTPSIDSLASPGVVFRRAFAHAPLTLPSHASMLSGTTPLRHGVHDNLGFRLPDGLPTLASRLKAAGYATAAFVGAFPLDSRFGLDRGFDLYDDLYGEKKTSADFYFVERRGEDVVRPAADWILGRKKGERWFAFLHLFDPHMPYAPPPPYNARFAGNPYAGEVAYADDCLGRLFTALRKNGLMEETLVVFTSDHGESLGEHGEQTHGYFAYNSTLHVPLIVHAPALFRERRAVDAAVSHADIFPTVCDLLGVKPPAGLEGRSLRPLLDGGRQATPPIYFESMAPFLNRNWAPLRGVIRDGRKYIDQPRTELYELGPDFREEKNLLPGADVSLFRKALRDLETGARDSAGRGRSGETREAERAMRSLGYLGGGGGTKKSFGPGDDLKALLPVHLKLMDAASLQAAGEPDEAVRLLEQVLEERTDMAAAYEYLADILRNKNDLEGAARTLRRGVSHCPGHYRLRGMLGILLSETGDQQGALREIRPALDINPGDAELWNYLGVALWKLGELDEAEDCYRRALDLDRNYAGALNNLGSLSLTRRDPDKALEFFDRSLAFDPRLASAHNGKAVVRSMKGDLEGAVASWRKALEFEPGHLLALYNIGLALSRLGRPEEALPYLEKYLRLAPAGDPDRDRAARLLSSLKAGK